MSTDFLGLGTFVFWFGVVENRLDPLELGRCQVRCFGWHTEDLQQIPISELPWAHPIVPYGVSAVQAPPEGTMVFGFFADGKEGRYPIIMGTVPGIPEEIRQSNMGFTDPYTDEQKASSDFPRRIKDAKIQRDSRGVRITEDAAKRNPSRLNEPTVSRLARPTRGVNADGTYGGIQSSSIANTTIDIQRRTRVPDIITADGGKTWDEPYPSFNAQYPFNNATETESGHAIELDDTEGFERVQVSHRTGSTLEFLPEGHTKIKSQKSRYDVTMGDHRSYVNGQRVETVDSDMFLRVNGKLRIECGDLEIVSANKTQVASNEDINVRSGKTLNLGGQITNLSGLDVNLAAANLLKMYGASQAVMKSGGVASVGGSLTHVSGGVIELITQLLLTSGIQDFNSNIPAVGKVGPTADFANPPDMQRAADLTYVPPAAQVPKTDVYSRIAEERATETPVESATEVPGATVSLPTQVDAIVSAVLDQNTHSVVVNVKIPENALDETSGEPITTTGYSESSSERAPPVDSSGYKGADDTSGT